MLRSLIIYLKGMRRMMFQLSGFYYRGFGFKVRIISSSNIFAENGFNGIPEGCCMRDSLGFGISVSLVLCLWVLASLPGRDFEIKDPSNAKALNTTLESLSPKSLNCRLP